MLDKFKPKTSSSSSSSNAGGGSPEVATARENRRPPSNEANGGIALPGAAFFVVEEADCPPGDLKGENLGDIFNFTVEVSNEAESGGVLVEAATGGGLVKVVAEAAALLCLVVW